eukprot:CAMPEP_0194060560 /NCGR_PEP_ID=MMETSP0009_2-20130614/72095_1 /TAXON_ID=210454 /ORGANISM="Grammatophora oceanica, Strain CCMP 410" /LENGTH=390 /DNA_ID=CAMNT_0038711507 /DNA_START=68 /DNA_END=1240 /DNA_ORIENTATION=-
MSAFRGLSPAFASLLSATTLSQTIHCDAPPPPPAAPPLAPADGSSKSAPPPPPTSADEIEQAALSVSDIPNPGPYEMASNDAKRLVTLDTHDGLRFDINKQLSLNMAVVHSFWLGTGMIPDGRNKTYTFLTQVADEDSLLMAQVDFDRQSVNGRIHKALLGGAAMGKLQLQLGNGEAAQDTALLDMDFGGQTWTANLKYGSMGAGLVYGCSYLQSLTPSLQMGGEGMYVAANQSLLGSYTLKYTMPAKAGDEEDDIQTIAITKQSPYQPDSAAQGRPPQEQPSSTFVANLNMGQQVLALNYKRIVTPNRVTLGAELQCNPYSLESSVLLGAEFKLTRSKVHMVLDGNGKLQSVVEAKMGAGQGVPTLSFAAEMDHPKDVMRFGFGLNIDS